MVVLDLIIRVVSENIKSLKAADDFRFYFIIECTQCKTEHPNEIYFSSSDDMEMPKGHGVANFMMTCKECKKGMSIANHKSKMEISCENGNDEDVFASFDCRGCELKKWIPKLGLILESNESEKCFEDVDISDVWCEYDEIGKVSCSLFEIVAHRFEKKKI